jgi:catechol 2,3-dioxygenase-like lactoylglutathione lyase family enzyme
MPSVFRRIEPRLHTADLARAVAFYREILGFGLAFQFPEDKPSFAMLERDDVAVQIGGTDATRTPSERSTCTLYVDVVDVRALHAALADKVPVEWGPEVFSYQRREFALRDPDGNLIILSEDTDDPPTHVE